MKREDIDNKIGMPDVDAEWAKFEREVIGREKASRKPLYWSIGIAAFIALVAGIFLFGNEEKEQTGVPVTKAEQPIAPSVHEEVETEIETESAPMAAQCLDADLLAMATPSKSEVSEATDDELQDRIAGQTIVPTSADLRPSNVLRLDGIKITGSDTARIGRKHDYDFLVVVDGQPLSEAEQKRMLSSDIHVYFFNRQQIVNSIHIYKDEDAKRPYVEKYGERAENAVMFITTAPDTLCDAYVQQHPELMQTRLRIKGYVIDKDTNEPLPDTWINYTGTINYKNVGDSWIKHTDGAGAATDSTGHFVLWLPRKDVKLQASRVGYVTVLINQPADTTLTIRMTPANIIKDVKIAPKSTIRIRGDEWNGR